MATSPSQSPISPGSQSLLGTVFKIGGVFQEYRANKNASLFNERLALQNAEHAIKVGREMERRQRVLGRQAIGSIKTGYAASGVALEGSALDVLEFSAANAELDALTIRYESEVRAHNFGAEAAAERQKREADKDALPFEIGPILFGG